MQPSEYIEETSKAVQQLFDALAFYRQILEEDPPPVHVARVSPDDEQAWQRELDRWYEEAVSRPGRRGCCSSDRASMIARKEVRSESRSEPRRDRRATGPQDRHCAAQPRAGKSMYRTTTVIGINTASAKRCARGDVRWNVLSRATTAWSSSPKAIKDEIGSDAESYEACHRQFLGEFAQFRTCSSASHRPVYGCGTDANQSGTSYAARPWRCTRYGVRARLPRDRGAARHAGCDSGRRHDLSGVRTRRETACARRSAEISRSGMSVDKKKS